jgi:hypothetical protein
VQNAKAALTKFESLDKLTIGSKPVAVAWPHAGVFRPARPSETIGTFTLGAASGDQTRFRYWYDGAYVSELRTGPPEIDPAQNAVDESVPDQSSAQEQVTKSKKRKADAEDLRAAKKVGMRSHTKRHAVLIYDRALHLIGIFGTKNKLSCTRGHQHRCQTPASQQTGHRRIPLHHLLQKPRWLGHNHSVTQIGSVVTSA